MGLSGLIRLGSKLGKATSGESRKVMTKAEKAIAEKLKKKGFKVPDPPKPNLDVTYGRRTIK
jgi:hypothetical protein|tara:strand:- start:309 stop:494 length:186 start_codon:yes stop_codon:yes gene_type:complete